MSDSGPNLGLPPFWTAALGFATLFLLLWMSAHEQRITPSEDDCLGRGRPVDCWRDTGKEVYDLNGKRQP